MKPVELNVWQCGRCGEMFIEHKDAEKCCTCKTCKWYIGRAPKKCGNPVFGGASYVHCRKGYSCDSFKSYGKEGTYSAYEQD